MEGDYDSVFLLEMNIRCSLRLPLECLRLPRLLLRSTALVPWALRLARSVTQNRGHPLKAQALAGPVSKQLDRWLGREGFQVKHCKDVFTGMGHGICCISSGLTGGKNTNGRGPWGSTEGPTSGKLTSPALSWKFSLKRLKMATAKKPVFLNHIMEWL